MSISNVGSSSSSSSSGSSSLTGVSATNVGPISFNGLGSGINSSSIIQQLTAISQQQEVPYQNKITQINSQNTELTTIQNLLSQFQGSLKALSDPSTFNSFSATSSNSAVATATQTTGSSTLPGTYTINNITLGTATSVTGSASIGQIVGYPAGTYSTTPLIDSYAQITPTNGGSGPGSVTVNGVRVSYDVNSQSITQILANITSQVQAATGDATFQASYDPTTDKVNITSQTNKITLGSATDSGNLLSVLKLDTAQIVNGNHSITIDGVTSNVDGSVVSSNGIGGVSEYATFNSKNNAGTTVNANFVTPVVDGTFSINGVSFTIDSSKDALSDVINRINSSNAGVTASYSQLTGRVTLTNNTPGAQSIVFGSTDTSHFLAAVGLTNGATTTVGTQSSVNFTDPTGTTSTVYSNSNNLTSVIPGFNLSLLQATSTPVTLNVSQSSSNAETAINTFVTSYNAVINELNNATQAPVVVQNTTSSSATGQSSSLGGGPFYGNTVIEGLKNTLVSLVSNFQTSGSSSYNSLPSIGLNLTTSFSSLTGNTNNNTSVSGSTNTSTNGVSVQTLKGTDGSFQALDTSKFEAAFNADPNAVQQIFTNSSNFVTQIGSYLTSVTGLSTILSTGLAGTVPSTSILAGIQNQNASLLSIEQKQIDQIQKQITNQANILQAQFNASNAAISSLQSEQSSLSAITGSSTSSSSSTSG